MAETACLRVRTSHRYRPELEFWAAHDGPKLGYCFWSEANKNGSRVRWSMRHVTHDLPAMAGLLEQLPFCIGDRVAFFVRVGPRSSPAWCLVCSP